METIQAYYNNGVFIPLAPVKAEQNQSALITILESANTKTGGNHYAEFFGSLSTESYSEIIEALKDTEKVDLNEW
jgi:predicted DNA-binding antitoxin AbrB/MazE fold protein